MTAAPEVAPGGVPAVSVERHGDRLMVTIIRRQTRAFSLSDDEAADLADSLRRELVGGVR